MTRRHTIWTQVSRFLLVIAKTIGGMTGAKTFDHDSARDLHARPKNHRP